MLFLKGKAASVTLHSYIRITLKKQPYQRNKVRYAQMALAAEIAKLIRAGKITYWLRFNLPHWPSFSRPHLDLRGKGYLFLGNFTFLNLAGGPFLGKGVVCQKSPESPGKG